MGEPGEWSVGVRGLMIGVGAVVGFLVLASLVIDEGEVAHLATVDTDGVEHEADLWVVDIDGVSYLRAHSARVSWLSRLQAKPQVRLKREAHDEWERYRAVVVDDPNVRARVDGAMGKKYGYTEVLWNLGVDPGSTVPIRLDPVPSTPGSP